jgi:hypothetical protein
MRTKCRFVWESIFCCQIAFFEICIIIPLNLATNAKILNAKTFQICSPHSKANTPLSLCKWMYRQYVLVQRHVKITTHWFVVFKTQLSNPCTYVGIPIYHLYLVTVIVKWCSACYIITHRWLVADNLCMYWMYIDVLCRCKSLLSCWSRREEERHTWFRYYCDSGQFRTSPGLAPGSNQGRGGTCSRGVPLPPPAPGWSRLRRRKSVEESHFSSRDYYVTRCRCIDVHT